LIVFHGMLQLTKSRFMLMPEVRGNLPPILYAALCNTLFVCLLVDMSRITFTFAPNL